MITGSFFSVAAPTGAPVAKKTIVIIKNASARKVAVWPTAGVFLILMQFRGHREV
jgi:hypothetical protein